MFILYPDQFILILVELHLQGVCGTDWFPVQSCHLKLDWHSFAIPLVHCTSTTGTSSGASISNSTSVALKMIVNHLKLEAGIDDNVQEWVENEGTSDHRDKECTKSFGSSGETTERW